MAYLGKGSYGMVVVQDGSAVKKFKKLSHLVQEYAAMRYLENTGVTVRAEGINFRQKKLAMELYDNSLRKWIENRGDKLTRDEIMTALHDILEGLAVLHAKGLAHGDLKPGNILVKSKPFGCVLGDLGFVSVARYSKCERTAPAYRDPVVKCATSHDMFSFGVICLELLGGLHFRKEAKYSRLREEARKHLRNRRYRELVLSLLSRRHEDRPSALEAMEALFGQTPSRRLLSYARPAPVSFEGFEEYEKWYSEVSRRFTINRPKRGAEAIVQYFRRHNPPASERTFMMLCCMMVQSAVFGPSGFSEDHVLLYSSRAAAGRPSPNFTHGHVFSALESLLGDKEFLSILFSP